MLFRRAKVLLILKLNSFLTSNFTNLPKPYILCSKFVYFCEYAIAQNNFQLLYSRQYSRFDVGSGISFNDKSYVYETI